MSKLSDLLKSYKHVADVLAPPPVPQFTKVPARVAASIKGEPGRPIEGELVITLDTYDNGWFQANQSHVVVHSGVQVGWVMQIQYEHSMRRSAALILSCRLRIVDPDIIPHLFGLSQVGVGANGVDITPDDEWRREVRALRAGRPFVPLQARGGDYRRNPADVAHDLMLLRNSGVVDEEYLHDLALRYEQPVEWDPATPNAFIKKK